MRAVYCYEYDAWYGEITGIFIADTQEVQKAIGRTVYFGECLGKHSEIETELEKGDFRLLTKDPREIDLLISMFEASDNNLFGYNPIAILKEWDEDYG